MGQSPVPHSSYHFNYFDSLSTNTKDCFGYSLKLFLGLWIRLCQLNNMGPHETTLSRHTILVIVSYLHATYSGVKWDMRDPKQLGFFMFRSVVFTMMSFGISWIQFYLPLSVCHTLSCSVPVFTFLCNYLINGVKATKEQIIGLAICIVGLALIINARLIYSIIIPGYEFETEFQNYQTDDIWLQIIICLLYLILQFLMSIAILSTKMLKYSVAEMIFGQCVIAIPISGMMYFYIEQSVDTWVYVESLFWLGCFLSFANYLFTYSLKIVSNTGKASVLLIGNALCSYFISVFRYGEGLNWFAVGGTVVITISMVLILVPREEQGNQEDQNEKKQKEMKEMKEFTLK